MRICGSGFNRDSPTRGRTRTDRAPRIAPAASSSRSAWSSAAYLSFARTRLAPSPSSPAMPWHLAQCTRYAFSPSARTASLNPSSGDCAGARSGSASKARTGYRRRRIAMTSLLLVTPRSTAQRQSIKRWCGKTSRRLPARHIPCPRCASARPLWRPVRRCRPHSRRRK